MDNIASSRNGGLHNESLSRKEEGKRRRMDSVSRFSALLKIARITSPHSLEEMLGKETDNLV